MKSLLGGEGADPELLRQIYRLLHQEESIQRIIHIRSLQLGPQDVLLTIKAEFNERLNSAQTAILISGIEKEIIGRFPFIKKIFIEPDLPRPA